VILPPLVFPGETDHIMPCIISLGISTFRIMALRITTVRIITLRLMTLRLLTLRMTTLGIMILSIANGVSQKFLKIILRFFQSDSLLHIMGPML
jgi:hypothetical protein